MAISSIISKFSNGAYIYHADSFDTTYTGKDIRKFESIYGCFLHETTQDEEGQDVHRYLLEVRYTEELEKFVKKGGYYGFIYENNGTIGQLFLAKPVKVEKDKIIFETAPFKKKFAIFKNMKLEVAVENLKKDYMYFLDN